MRLDKYLVMLGLVTRSTATSYLKKNPIYLDDAPLKANDQIKNGDVIIINSSPHKVEEEVYFILNKPTGFLCENGPANSVFNLIKERCDLISVGRLDKDTTGLLILTSDGKVVHQITSPKTKITKTYIASLNKDLSDEEIADLLKGIYLDDKLIIPQSIKRLDDKTFEIIITEGIYHEVKRIFASKGAEVISLKRIAIGGLFLEDLGEGMYKKLEYSELIKKINNK